MQPQWRRSRLVNRPAASFLDVFPPAAAILLPIRVQAALQLLSTHRKPPKLLHHRHCRSTDTCHPAHIVGVMQQGTVRAAGARLVFVARDPQFSNLGIVAHSRLKRVLSSCVPLQFSEQLERPSLGSILTLRLRTGFFERPPTSNLDIHGKTLVLSLSPSPRDRIRNFQIFAQCSPVPTPSASAPFLMHSRRTPCTLTISRTPQSPTSPRPRTRAGSGPCGSLREAQRTCRMLNAHGVHVLP
ncbi:hypothetical protein DFH06DRAFT_85083 [Mycena polygramma]|nr:hypothetical protein DFH06DRAFT_85083 [Mycena polygramma]